MLVREIVLLLKNVAGSIADIKEVIRDNILLEAGFKAAVRQMSERIDLSALLINLCGLLRKEHRTLEHEIAPGVAVQGFRIQLWQGLDNVIRNAIQASSPHELIRVTCEGTADGAVVTVRDHGRGFRQTTWGRSPKRASPRGRTGHGLGLHTLAVFLPGPLAVSWRWSRPGSGRGTTVKVTIRNGKVT